MIKRIVLPILVVVATYASLLVFIGSNAWVHIDAASFALVPVLPLVYMAFVYGLAGMLAAFRAPGSAAATDRELRLAVAFFKDLGRAFWMFGILASATGLVEVLRNLTDPARLGPNLAVAILTILYSATFNLVLVMPFQATARRRLAENSAA
ncbi:MAG TPA: MotA/TolQ/ExbB proton channel family protein [bacterium]|nr:MotA/TolQ/ExbB proton channel family protein [bacterium]